MEPITNFYIPCSQIRCSLFPIPYSLFPIPYSLFPIPYSLLPTPCYIIPNSVELVFVDSDFDSDFDSENAGVPMQGLFSPYWL
ncbi:hypothetical protein [Moorena producens]|uniref:hypothetical protein n=1 Tax=Moorena producens TaxID=1155739 RepID=UPI003C738BC4